MNPLTLLKQTELNIAVRIDDRDRTRTIARHLSHYGPRPAWVPLGALPMVPFVRGAALAPLVMLGIVNLLVLIASCLADRTHEVGGIDEVHPCPLCPRWEEGDDGPGGGWNDNDLPSAPPPMDDFDLDRQLAALVEEVTA